MSGTGGSRTLSFWLMRPACYRYTTVQSLTSGSNRRDQFGRLACCHYISEARGQFSELSSSRPDGRNRTSITCSQGRRYTISLHPDVGRGWTSPVGNYITLLRHAVQVRLVRLPSSR